ncbi:MAG: ABC transporter substrate-binding protein [Sciscionella sp.]
MRSKPIVCMGVALATGALLAACGGQVGGSSGSNSGASTPKNKNIVYIPGDIEPFYTSIQCAAKAEATKLGYKFTMQGAQKFSADAQTPIVTAVANKKPAGVLIAPTDNVAMANPIKELTSAGSKVVEVDTALKDNSITVSSVSTDNPSGGKLAADTLAKLLAGKKGSVLVLNTVAGTSTTDQREQGFAAEIKKHPNLTMLPQQYTNNDPATASQKVSQTLSAHPDLVGIFATNLQTGQGAGAALQSAGAHAKVKLVGFDASPNEVTDLRNGTFQALIAQDPATIGKDGVDQVVNAIEGKPVTKHIGTKLVSITQQDMNSKQQYFYKSKC